MSPKGKDYKPPTRAELQAMRAEKIQPQSADPKQEAQHHETLFLKGIGSTQQEFDWLIEHNAWTLLGYESVVHWWERRVRPVMVQLSVQPTPEMVEKILKYVREAEQALPPQQRRKQRELAEFALASEWRTRGRVETRKRRTATGADLEGEFTEQTSAGPGVPADQADPVGAGTPEDSAGSGDASIFAGSTGDGGVSADVAAPQTSGDQESKDAPVEDTPAGQIPSSGSNPPLNGQPGLETPAATVATPAPDADREQEESGEGASSPDNQNPFIDWVHDLVDVVGQRIDVEDGFTTDEDLKLLLRNAVADLQDHLGELEFVWMRDLAGEVSA